MVEAVVDGASAMTSRKDDVTGVMVVGFHMREPKMEVVVVVVATGTRGMREMMQSGTMEVIKAAAVLMPAVAGEETKEVTTTGTTKVAVGVEEVVDGKPSHQSTIIAAFP